MKLSVDDENLALARAYLPTAANQEVSNLIILEWLGSSECHTGEKLFQWAENYRNGWAKIVKCESKEGLLGAIVNAESSVRRNGSAAPILHIESHGSKCGISGGSNQEDQFLPWEDLIPPLQKLNAATRCSLIVFFAACEGYAGVKTFQQGPYAPALAIAGPSETVLPEELLRITKEFYRRLMDETPDLTNMVESASRESNGCVIDYEPFSFLAFESCLDMLRDKLTSDRPPLGLIPAPERRRVIAAFVQDTWDKMFFIDAYPENEARFGVNWSAVIEHI